MRIIEVNLEDVDLTEAKIGQFFRGQNSCGRGQWNQNPYQGQYQNNSYQGNNDQGNHGLYHNPRRHFQQDNNYGQFKGRSHGHGRGNYHGPIITPLNIVLRENMISMILCLGEWLSLP